MLLPEIILGKKNYLCMGKYLDKLLRESFNDKVGAETSEEEENHTAWDKGKYFLVFLLRWRQLSNAVLGGSW